MPFTQTLVIMMKMAHASIIFDFTGLFVSLWRKMLEFSCAIYPNLKVIMMKLEHVSDDASVIIIHRHNIQMTSVACSE